MTLKLGMQHQLLKYYQIYTNEDHGLTLTYFMEVKFFPFCFCMDFSETIVVYYIKLVDAVNQMST